MHKESLEHMKINIGKYLKPCKILDVGSLNVKKKGCYREILPKEFEYVGIDLVPGPNVDIVLKDPHVFPFSDCYFDAVISGQCFEHASNPFSLIKECSRVLIPGGYFIGAAPSKWPIHSRPDRWRILPDGWRSLFEHAGLVEIDIYINSHEVSLNQVERFQDCWGIAKK